MIRSYRRVDVLLTMSVLLLVLSACFRPFGELEECDETDAVNCDALDESADADASLSERDRMGDDEFGDFDEFYIEDYRRGETEEDYEPVASYTIEPDLALSEIDNIDPENDELFRLIWSNVRRILPEHWLKDLFSEFHINSDGKDATLAYVQLDEYQPGRWVIAFDDVDYPGPGDKEFIHTVMHEFGHVVFLGGDQIDSDAVENCQTYFVEEGCTRHHSYINRFYQLFWEDIAEENAAVQDDEDRLLSFYDKYQDRFITEYAATDPIEDAAEVFTHFVLREKPFDNGVVVNQKIRFMHRIMELAELRDELRQNLSLIRENQGKPGFWSSCTDCEL